MSNKATKRALLTSALALLLCVSMLVGTTYAWFTDSVTSANNKIVAGNLKIDLELLEKDGSWTSIKESPKAIFDYKNWEPGYIDVKVLRVVNEGSLALKWTAQFVSEKELSKLADVIDVYVNNTATAYPTDRADLSGWTYAGTVSEFVNTIQTTTYGTLEAEKSAPLGIALKMREDAGNEYQGLDLGGAFDIKIYATQYTFESDSFGPDYDKAATWNGRIPASLEETTLEIVPGGGSQTGTITINSAEDLVYLSKLAKEWVSLYSNGQGTNVGNYRENVGGKGTDYYYHWAWTIELAVDLDMNNIPMDSADISYWDDFDGKGHTISNVVLKDGQDGLFLNGAKAVNNLTVKNIIVNAPEAETVGAVSGNGAMTNVHVENATVVGGKYVGGICGKGSGFTNCSIKNSTVTGTDKTVGGLVGYSIGDPNAVTVTGNTVENVTVTGAYNVGGLLGQSQNETVKDNTVKNVTVVSTTALPAGASSNEVRTAQLAARSNFANTTIGANTIENVTVIEFLNVADTAALQDAINGGEAYIALGKGDFTADLYNISARDSLTIIGQGAATKLAFKNLQVRASQFKNLTISNCTIERMPNKSWGHLVFGSSTQAGGVYTISNCIFNGVGSQGIYINQNVEATFNIENCTFNGNFGGEGAITVQNNDGVDITVNVTDCDFNDIPATSHEICVLYAFDGWTLNAEGVTAFWKTNP